MRCTPAWLDISEGQPRTDYPLLVESSRGAKSRKTKHPGTLELDVNVNAKLGTGILVQLIPPYARAMKASGSPLLSRLFMPRNAAQDGFNDDEYKSDAFKRRLQKNLKKQWECGAARRSQSAPGQPSFSKNLVLRYRR